jgi:hypothetical protein
MGWRSFRHPDEAGTHKVLIWGSLAGEVLVAIGILLEIERPLNLKKVLSFAAVIIGGYSWSGRNIIAIEI